MIKEAIILAGGLGTRLRSAVPDVPKCMAPVNDFPFIFYVMAYLQKQGITHFIFSLGYKSEMVTSYLEKVFPNLSKTYVIEEEPLGTGGGIKKALQAAKENDVIVVNGDTIFTVELDKLSHFHFSRAADCTLALKHVSFNERYGTVETGTENKVTGFKEKKEKGNGYINGGIYIIKRERFLEAMPREKFSFEKDYLEKFINRHTITGIPCNNFFIDIGVPEDYYRFIEKTKAIKTEREKGESKFFAAVELIGSILNGFDV